MHFAQKKLGCSQPQTAADEEMQNRSCDQMAITPLQNLMSACMRHGIGSALLHSLGRGHCGLAAYPLSSCRCLLGIASLRLCGQARSAPPTQEWQRGCLLFWLIFLFLFGSHQDAGSKSHVHQYANLLNFIQDGAVFEVNNRVRLALPNHDSANCVINTPRVKQDHCQANSQRRQL